MDIFIDRPFARDFERYKDQQRISQPSVCVELTREQFLRDIEPSGYPLIIRSKKEVQSWDEVVARLLHICPDLELAVRFGDYANPAEYVEHRELRKEKLSSFLAKMVRGPRTTDNSYAGNQYLPLEFCNMLGVQPPPVYPVERFEPPALWLGGAGSITPLHKDGSDNFAVHIFGRKRWTLFPIRDIPYLYMRRIVASSDFAVSEIDLRQPDLKRFPFLAQTERIEVILDAGDTLFLPRGWGHFIENLESTLMINFWIREDRKL